MHITLTDYWMGRDKMFPHDLGSDIRANAETMVALANRLLTVAKASGVTLEMSPRTGSVVSSGWRPPSVNAGTPGAAIKSKHMRGQAIDIYDPDGDLDEWLMTAQGQETLQDIGLWMEHPSATKGWCHLQSIPPGSKRRVFYP